MATKTKKKNPQDATLRNVTALKKRVDVLEKQVKLLVLTVKFLVLEGGDGPEGRTG